MASYKMAEKQKERDAELSRFTHERHRVDGEKQSESIIEQIAVNKKMQD